VKIAVVHNLPSGGAKRVLHGLVRRWSCLGCTVDVFTVSTADEGFLDLRSVARAVTVEPLRTTAAGVLRSTLRYLPPFLPFRISLGDLETAHRRIAERIDAGGFDVTFVEQDGYTVSPFVLRFLTGPRVYYCPQPCRLQEVVASRRRLPGRLRPLRAVIERAVAARLVAIDRANALYAPSILVNSRFTRQNVLDAYGREASVCYLGVDLDLFRPLGRRREHAVLSVGYLGGLKGHDFVVAALGRIPEPRRPRLIVAANVAEGPWREHLARLATAAGVHLEIRSAVSDSDLLELYNTAKLFVYAAHREPFGLAPVEAMACGTPVVAVADGGVRESVVHGETGLLTERSEPAFAEAVTQLLADESRRALMSRRAVAAARAAWSIDQAADRVLDHLRQAVVRPHESLRLLGAPGT
jgi:glycosyltransferase involved in cell wall biosynthesis